MKTNNICSVLINTCDKYEDAWYPFFELVKKYWSNCTYKFYLNTEKKEYNHNDIELTVLNQLGDANISSIRWGERLKSSLNYIDTPFVILLLEDFFLQDFVDFLELENCIKMMEQDENLVAIYFKRIKGFTESYSENSNYFIMNENKKYKVNLQAGIWRKSELQKLIYRDDSPWSIEENGQNRIENTKMKFLCSKKGTHSSCKDCVFPYLTDRKLGYGIWRGKWMWKNNKLLNRNGIKLNKISMDKFTRFDMILYYFYKLKERLYTIK